MYQEAGDALYYTEASQLEFWKQTKRQIKQHYGQTWVIFSYVVYVAFV